MKLEDSTDQVNIYGNGCLSGRRGSLCGGSRCNQKPIEISLSDVLTYVALIDDVGGDRFKYKAKEGWSYAEIENEFHALSDPSRMLAKQVIDVRSTFVVLYVFSF